MSDPTARTLALLSLLQTHRYWKGDELAARLEVSARTVRRDVDRLRQLGYSVDAGPGADGGYRLAVGTHIPPMMFDDDEAIALVVGLRSAAAASVDGIQDTSVALMSKLEMILPDRLRRRIDALRTSMEVMTWSPGGATVSPRALSILSQGCRDDEEVRFDYQRRDGERSRRLVQPHHLVSAGHRWYLVAWDVRRDDWRSFRVDRLEAPALAGARFERHHLPADDAADFVRRGIRAMNTEVAATIVVEASTDDAAGLAGWMHADDEVIDENHTRLHLRAESSERLASMIAIVAARYSIEIDDLPDDVRRRLQTVAARLAAAG